MKHLTRPLAPLLVMVGAALLIFTGMGCNTAHGFGKDVSNAGQGIQNGTK